MARGKRIKDIACKEGTRRDLAELKERCEARARKRDDELPPPRTDFDKTMEGRGISRREFMKWTSFMTAAMMLPPSFRPYVAQAARDFNRVPVVWLHFAECTGCSEALLRTSGPGVDELILDTLSLEYHETLMAAAGYQAEENLAQAMIDFPGEFLCVIEGAVPTGLGGQYLTLGPEGKTGLERAGEVTAAAAGTVCIGSCASFGNVPAAEPNPTDAMGVGDALGIQTVNISGCPPNPSNFVGTLLEYITTGEWPMLDSLGRPHWIYRNPVHNTCERKHHFNQGEFVQQWGDEGAKNGWCLLLMGCKGPYTHGNCSEVLFNDEVSWPVRAGHGCMGCTEPDFWDAMAPIEEPLKDDKGRLVEPGGEGMAAAAIGAVAAAGYVVARAGDDGRGEGVDRDE